jgi:hypothetical protein
MSWSHYLAYFLGGAFLANFVPHFVAGVSGRSFPSPFATPPFRGLSSPVVNVLWGLINLGAAYVLLVLVANLELQQTLHVAISAVGFTLAAIGVARAASRAARPDARPI